jgi:uncharacterized protein YndB with AHSA1/START domain
MIVDTALVIRRPVEEVFRAFVDPAVTTRFWFTRSSGPLEPGATVSWDWEMFDVGTKVSVKEVVPNERIRIEWNPDDPSTVRWTFTPHERGTHVRIVEDDIKGDVAAHALDSMQGFSLVLAGAKAWLEHGIELNLVADHG